MATITSILTTGRRGAAVTINGTGFGASQSNSVLLFWPVNGATSTVTPTSWSATQIQAIIPTDGNDADLRQAAFFSVAVENDKIPAKSTTFTLLAEAVPAMTTFPPGTWIFTADTP